MTAHDHAMIVPGCHRCELTQDEIAARLTEDPDQLLLWEGDYT